VPPSSKHELQALQTQAQHLERTVNEIKQRITELETTKDEGVDLGAK
jgi:prefoldin subunit 5